MMFNEIVEEFKIIAIIRGVPNERVIDTVQALYVGGT